jgi:hypothetical protein
LRFWTGLAQSRLVAILVGYAYVSGMDDEKSYWGSQVKKVAIISAVVAVLSVIQWSGIINIDKVWALFYKDYHTPTFLGWVAIAVTGGVLSLKDRKK